MKKRIKEVSYNGEQVSRAFIAGFQKQVLETLHKRGLLSDKQLLRGISLLRERIR